MSNKRRKITLSKNNLDPLSRWYFSKEKYGDSFGIRTANPINSDSRLFVDGVRDIGIGGRPPSDPHVRWSLAGTNENGEPNPGNVPSLVEFVNAALADEVGRFLEFQNENNQFIYVEKAVGTSPETYNSMAAGMLEAVLTTSDYILREAIRPRSQLAIDLAQYSMAVVNGRNVTDPVFESFIRALGNSSTFFEGPREGPPDPEDRIRFGPDIVIPLYNDLRLRLRTFDPPIITLADFLAILGVRVLTSSTTESTKKFIKYFIATEVSKIASPSSLVAAARGLNIYDNRHHYVEVETPYVSTRESSNFLEELSTGEPYRAGISSDYSSYIQNYEERIKEAQVPEAILPNNYIRKYYKELVDWSQIGFGIGPDQTQKHQELRQILDLGGEVSQEALDSIYETSYYSSYGRRIPGLNMDSQSIQNIKSKNKSIIFDSVAVANDSLRGIFAPMSVGVEFTRGSFGHYQDILADEEFNIRDATQALFENIKNTPLQDQRQFNFYSTEYLKKVNGGIGEFESPFSVVPLREFRISRLFTTWAGYPEFSSVVLTTEEDRTPDGLDFFGLSLGLSQQGTINSRRSYGAIVNGDDSRSESLGYKITKSAPTVGNAIVQEIFIANGLGDKVITYTDSQIKYGADYDYTLSEYRLIYGTKYKFRVLSPDLPSWVMENYLGLSSDARDQLSQIATANEQFLIPIPNITFNAYVEEASDPVVTEIPIYDEVFNRTNIFRDSAGTNESILGISGIGGAGAISYPRAKVLDRPPTAPVLDIFPLVGIKDQVKMSVNLQTGNSTGTRNSREIISIGDMSDRIRELKEYQDNYTNRFLPPNKLEYKNEGLAELKNIILYRTTQLDLDVENYNDIYQSFNPETNSNVLVRRYTDKVLREELSSGIIEIPSYDILDNIQPNVNYYYTCVVEDIHGNPSNPSIIYRVRLLLDKGLLLPEVDTVLPMGAGQKKPQKNLTRYIQIDASNIQSFPYIEAGGETSTSSRSLGAALGKSIEDQGYIVRFTSKDTGRKIDLKLNFVIRVDGVPINVGT
tara:strand:+ start:3057 stop:6152 length:3096 start_codon:yes stop_codon:yes gene_type:complete